jgi:hypothetical protein
MENYKAISEKINAKTECHRRDLQKELFDLYDNDKELQKILDKVENGDFEDYTFDEAGYLNGVVSIDTKKYPDLQDYIDVRMRVGYVSQYDSIESAVGQPITVNWNHGRGSYFIYDGESGKPIVAKHDQEKTEEYYHAVIEQYQRKSGVFNDVVEIDDRYGNYLKHLDVGQNIRDLSDEGLENLIKELDKEEEN